ncbi:WD repeat domain-containing protein [Colletotrichum costaricense]|uniref:WD repeat domain-containing protein n=2 Tax=Colletotrichum acutatum species complex TaxID=2707335 RepID=A0AAJ0E0W1_9PEZI|nr:WD repeat domain-containing protein [Colletotrichum costaricense]XP_060385349.1 WD repeat domain-containing protein [Colletotrichum tamarilloi]KAI3543961.1 WD repeat domain-containing protein [Colletotrichum filicis]KAK1504591.1 WD repeat domain-containing protein [Colletotrichum tamarilloi]KAK1526226.1 WD repeat domain-containing protein [Colletotrichum costaricense]
MTLPTDSLAALSASGSIKRPVADASNSATATPTRFATPPPPSDRGLVENRQYLENTNQRKIQHSRRPSESARSSAFDPDAVDSALLREMHHRSQRESTPGASPHRKRQRINGDRFIPTRTGQDLQASFNLLHEDGSPATPSKQKKRTPHGELHFQKTEEANRTFSTLLRAELFEGSIPQATPPTMSPEHTLSTASHSANIRDSTRSRTPPNNASTNSLPSSLTPSTPHKNLFSYMSPRNLGNAGHLTPSRTPQSRHGPNLDTRSEIYSLSPVRFNSQQMLLSPRRQPRAVSKVPYKVLDAPDLADDFYLNLVDWGSANVLGVGLGSSVYMWNAQTSRVNKLCTLEDDTVTSVSWIQKGTHIAIGTGKGLVQIWDAEKTRRLRTMTGHTARVGSLAWNTHILTSGSRDRLIYHRDVRAPDQWLRKLVGHKQEVCGLKWNCEDGQLASGGNDNKLMVWDKLSETPLWKFSDHTAAVKAIAWSPHQRGLLASGGGTADRRIIFHDTVRGSVINEIDTGSQVCNIAWSKNSNEIVSTHGYSQNQIVVWKYPSMTQVVSLTGHTYRVLYLAMSPDGRTVVTGAGDETLRFWNAFGRRPGAREDSDGGRLSDWGVIR